MGKKHTKGWWFFPGKPSKTYIDSMRNSAIKRGGRAFQARFRDGIIATCSSKEMKTQVSEDVNHFLDSALKGELEFPLTTPRCRKCGEFFTSVFVLCWSFSLTFRNTKTHS